MAIYIRQNVNSSINSTVTEIPYSSETNDEKLSLYGGSYLYGLYRIEIPWTINFDGRETDILYLSTQNKLHVDPRTEEDIQQYNYRYLSLTPVGLPGSDLLFSTNAYYKLIGTSPNRILNVRHESARSERPAGVNFQTITNPGVRSTDGMVSLYDKTVDGAVAGDYESTVDIPWQFRFVRDTGHPANQIVVKHGLPWITWRDTKSLIDLPQSTTVQRDTPIESEVWFQYGINDEWLVSQFSFTLLGQTTYIYYYEVQNIWYEVFGSPGNRTFVLKIQSTTLNAGSPDEPIEFDMYFYENKQDEVNVVVDTLPASIDVVTQDVSAGFFYRDRDFVGDYTNAWEYVAPLSGILDGPNYDNKATRFYQSNPVNSQSEFNWELTLYENNTDEAQIHIGNMFYAVERVSSSFDESTGTSDNNPGGGWHNSEIFYAQNKWFMQAEKKDVNTSFWYSTDCLSWQTKYVESSSPYRKEYGRRLGYDEENDWFVYLHDYFDDWDPDFYTNTFSSNVDNSEAIYQEVPLVGGTYITNTRGIISHVSTDAIVWEYDDFTPLDVFTSNNPVEDPPGSGNIEFYRDPSNLPAGDNNNIGVFGNNIRFDGIHSLHYGSFWNYFAVSQTIPGFIGFMRQTTYGSYYDRFTGDSPDSNRPTQNNSKESYVPFVVEYNPSGTPGGGPFGSNPQFFLNTQSGFIGATRGYIQLRDPLAPENITYHNRTDDDATDELFVISSRNSPHYYTERGYQSDYYSESQIFSNITAPKIKANSPNIFSIQNLPVTSGSLNRIAKPVNYLKGNSENFTLGIVSNFIPLERRVFYDTYNGLGPYSGYRKLIYQNLYGYQDVNDYHDNLKSITHAQVNYNWYTGGQWMAVGRHQNIVSSTDTIHWMIERYIHPTFDVGPVDSGGQPVTTDLVDFDGWPGRKTFGSELLSITYGNNIWVAGGKQKFYDGSTGTDRRIIVCRDPNVSGIKVSPGFQTPLWEPIVWQVRTGDYINAVDSAAYGNGKYVMVGGSESEAGVPGQANILHSTDSIHWLGQSLLLDGATSAVGRGFNSVTYGNGQFVAVGNQTLVATSVDGSFWVVRTGYQDPVNPTTAGYNWLDIEYGNGYYLAANDYVPFGLQDQPRFYRSTDAVHWEVDGINANNLSGFKLRFSPTRIKYGNGYWFAAHTGDGVKGRNQNSENVDGIDLCLSTDTFNWQLQYTKMLGVPEYEKKGFGDPPKGMSDIAVNSNNDFVAVGYMPEPTFFGNSEFIELDEDVNEGNDYYLQGYTGPIISVANGLYFAINKTVPIDLDSVPGGDDNKLSVSTNAVFWSLRTMALPGNQVGGGQVTYDNDLGRYIFLSERVGTSVSSAIQYSTDTIHWEEELTSLTFGNSGAAFGGPTNAQYLGGKLIGWGSEHADGFYSGGFEYGEYSKRDIYDEYPHLSSMYRHVFCGEFTRGTPDGRLEVDIEPSWTVRTVPIPNYVSHSTSGYNQEFISSLVKGDDYWIAKMDVLNPTRSTISGLNSSTPESRILWHVRTLQYSSGAYSWNLSNVYLPAESSGHIIASTDFIHWQLRTTAHGPDTNPTDDTGSYSLGTTNYHHVVQAKISYGDGIYAILGQDYTKIINETFDNTAGNHFLLPSRLETSTDTIHWTIRTLGIPYSIDPDDEFNLNSLEGSFGFIKNDYGQGNAAFDIKYGTVNGISQWIVIAYSVGSVSGGSFEYDICATTFGNPFRMAASTDAIHWTARTAGLFLIGPSSEGTPSAANCYGIGDYEISCDENIWVVYNKAYDDQNSRYSTDGVVWNLLDGFNFKDTKTDVERIGYIGNDIWVQGNAGGWARGETAFEQSTNNIPENGLDGIDSDQIKYGSYSDYINKSFSTSTIGDSAYYAINSVCSFRNNLGRYLYAITSKFGVSKTRTGDFESSYEDDSAYINHLALSTDLIVWDVRTANSGLKINENGVGYPSSVEYLTSDGGPVDATNTLYGHCMVGPMVEMDVTTTTDTGSTNSISNGLYDKTVLELATPKSQIVGYEFDFSAPIFSWEDMKSIYYYDANEWVGVGSAYYYDGNSWVQIYSST